MIWESIIRLLLAHTVYLLNLIARVLSAHRRGLELQQKMSLFRTDFET